MRIQADVTSLRETPAADGGGDHDQVHVGAQQRSEQCGCQERVRSQDPVGSGPLVEGMVDEIPGLATFQHGEDTFPLPRRHTFVRVSISLAECLRTLLMASPSAGSDPIGRLRRSRAPYQDCDTDQVRTGFDTSTRQSCEEGVCSCHSPRRGVRYHVDLVGGPPPRCHADVLSQWTYIDPDPVTRQTEEHRQGNRPEHQHFPGQS